ncbi:unnamed protein product [Allacma fusca]|uniref:Uncharacterized protein n=1 Tax=Allacma fusca TaxID=39272 RepID=A0A8J2JNR3_9HEXA|nr:unnamed protein product [Allacma fusca]
MIPGFYFTTRLELIIPGLARPELRSLAYDYVKSLSRKNTFNSIRQKTRIRVGKRFLRRHPGVSFRILQVNFSLSQIYNMEETCLSIVQKPLPILARRGTNSVGRITSGERGRLITAMYCCSATGVFIPPMLVFPGKRFKAESLNACPAGFVAREKDNITRRLALLDKEKELLVLEADIIRREKELLRINPLDDSNPHHEDITSVIYLSARQLLTLFDPLYVLLKNRSRKGLAGNKVQKS